jgi:glutamate racemase
LRIGFFDSGIGGLTVLAEAMARLPGADLLYFADTASVPYGDKPREVVRTCVFRAVDFLVDQGIEALVVACNTATSVAIEDLRRRHRFPIIGMEPAVKPALLGLAGAAGGPGSRVLALATDMTLREEKFRSLVERVDAEARVDYLSLQGLVARAEAFQFEPEATAGYLRAATAHLDLAAYGAVVLGCTHFPYYRPQLRALFGPDTALVDGNRGTVNNLCAQLGPRLPEPGDGSVAYFESGPKGLGPAAAPGRFRAYLDYYGRLEATGR